MKWSDLKRLEALIQQAEVQGACVEEIGLSSEGRSLYGVTIGNKFAKRTVLIVAGFHAAEVIAPLTAIKILQTFPDHALMEVRLCIVPVADPDFTFQNANALPEIVTLQSLLNLEHQRDLEGYFTSDLYPECVAIRHWIGKLDRVDAYLSLHRDLANASLAEIDRCNQQFKQTGQTDFLFQEIDLETQLSLMTSWIWAVIETVVTVA